MAGENKETNFLAMSDEELLNAAPPSFEAPAAEETAAETPPADEGEQNAAEDEAADAADAGDAGEDADAAEETEEGKGAEGAAEGDQPDADPKAAEAKKGEKEDKGKPEGTGEEAKPADKKTGTVDYEAEYKKLLTPFRANGRDIQVESVDEAVALMQMGANYNKKMAALKPNLKLMKMLENNGLLSEEKIGFLIDLGKKDPAAINKLVKDSGLDPLDLTAEKAEAYKQSSYAVGDQELELDTVLEDLKDSTTYTQTLDVVSNKWDGASKRIVAEHPQLLTVIDSHIASGIYDLISKQVERERTFGRLQGLSDIEAYRQVGDAMNAQGKFNHLAPKTESQGETAAKEPIVVPPKAKTSDDPKRNEKRRAVSSNPTAAPAAAKQDFNPLSMKDEDFLKVANSRFGQ